MVQGLSGGVECVLERGLAGALEAVEPDALLCGAALPLLECFIGL